MKIRVSRYGINPALVGNHCLRAGGATDLFRRPFRLDRTIKKYGRWTPEAAILYQRDDWDICRRIQEGFQQL